MPDWKNKDEYPPIRRTSLDRWAAEFLLRNPEFVTEYQAAKTEQGQLDKSRMSDYWSTKPTGKVLKKYGVKLPNIWGDEYGDSPVYFNNNPVSLMKVDVENAGLVFSEAAVGRSFFITPYDKNLSVLAFDLTQPIKPQLDRAKRFLIASQKNLDGKKRVVGKSIVRLYPFYLRVLDAYAQGARPAKICEVLSQDYQNDVSEDTLRNWKNEAERLRDGGYLDIVRNPKP